MLFSPVSNTYPRGGVAMDLSYEALRANFDHLNGGFGNSGKGLPVMELLFLLRYWRRTGTKEALQMVETTLRGMRQGAIYDQVGFGFHHECAQADWQAPSLRKELEDQAWMALLYVEAFQATGREEFAATANELFTYVTCDLSTPEGLLLTADGGPEMGDGRFYEWTYDQILAALGPDQATLFLQVFAPDETQDKTTTGNSDSWLPRMREPLEQTARRLHMDLAALEQRLRATCTELFVVREARRQPTRDERIEPGPNGLMLVALARGAQVLGDAGCREVACRIAELLLRRLRDDGKGLYARLTDGRAGGAGGLLDHAYVVWGLLELYETTFDVSFLEAAIEIDEVQSSRFWQPDLKAMTHTAMDRWKLVSLDSDPLGGALAQANAVTTLNLLRIGTITAEPRYEIRARECLDTFMPHLIRHPLRAAAMLVAEDFISGPTFEVVIASAGESGVDTEDMLRALRRPFLPNKVVLFRPDRPHEHPITEIAPFTEYQISMQGASTAYVCEGYQCTAPTTDIDTMLRQLDAGRPFHTI